MSKVNEIIKLPCYDCKDLFQVNSLCFGRCPDCYEEWREEIRENDDEPEQVTPRGWEKL